MSAAPDCPQLAERDSQCCWDPASLASPYGSFSECAQKRDELLTLFGGKVESEFMTSNGPGLGSERTPSAGDVCVLQPVGIKHLFKGGDGAVMEISSPIP